ncbi:MAG: hypothetical protein NTZ26_04140 [Candidatus Aminicenantes bacterium]|nr:hypothetical protein [Candidatus Aminicenantes bacterium]
MRTLRAYFLAVLAVGLIALPAVFDPTPALAQATQWIFRVVADPAPVRVRPDITAPQIDAFVKGTEVKSYATEGAWVRFLVTRKDGSVLVGYVSASDLELVETKEESTVDFWTSPDEAFRGTGFVFRFSGGIGTLGGGDLLTGISDRFQTQIEQLLALDYTPLDPSDYSFKIRTSFSGEMLYHFTPRFGLGLGAAVAYAHTFGESVFTKYFPIENKAVVEPNIRTMAYFATAAYLLPINKLLSVRFSGGPMWVQTKYSFHGMTPAAEIQTDFIQRADGSGFGAQAGIALELNLNERAALYLEVSGRAGTIRNFQGTQTTSTVLANHMAYEDDVAGNLYAVETDGKTLLMILPDPSLAPGPYREAGYNLTGVDARFGFRIRF